MLKIEHMSKSFMDREILKDVNLSINDGEIVSIVGNSGIGKTTMLRCICCLEKADAGTIEIDGSKLSFGNCTKKQIDEVRLKTGIVFQTFDLFKHRTVIQNVRDALIKVKKIEKNKANEIALSHLSLMDMDGYCEYYPRQLSGGQQQRVAIARMVAMSPELLMFDEPTSALDSSLKEEITKYIKKVSEGGRMIIIVTHDYEFAKQVSNRILRLDNGIVMEENL